MLIHVNDYDPRRPLRWSFPGQVVHHRWQIIIILCSRNLSLERLTGSDPCLNAFGVVQEVAED